MINFGPRVPLHWQQDGMSKAVKKNPSYESARKNEIHPSNYSAMDERPSSMQEASRIRRNVDGTLDYNCTMNTILDAIHKAETGMNLTPIEESLLTVFFPLKFKKVEAAQAEIRTQLSRTEKSYLKDLIDGHLKEELNYNAGRGGSSLEGRSRTLTE